MFWEVEASFVLTKQLMEAPSMGPGHQKDQAMSRNGRPAFRFLERCERLEVDLVIHLAYVLEPA